MRYLRSDTSPFFMPDIKVTFGDLRQFCEEVPLRNSDHQCLVDALAVGVEYNLVGSEVTESNCTLAEIGFYMALSDLKATSQDFIPLAEYCAQGILSERFDTMPDARIDLDERALSPPFLKVLKDSDGKRKELLRQVNCSILNVFNAKNWNEAGYHLQTAEQLIDEDGKGFDGPEMTIMLTQCGIYRKAMQHKLDA